MPFGLLALHIPDGFLSLPVSIAGWLLAAVLVWLAVRQTRQQFGEAQAPVMGVLAAFIFAAQAINFPIAGGTSGHLLGGALAGIVMGPWAGTLIMTAVIVVQGLMFQDGGLLVMGWNIVNMGALTVLTGYAAYTLVFRLVGERKRLRPAAALAAAWLSVEVAAVATALQLSASGTFAIDLSLPALTGVHVLVGLGEGLVTAAAVSLLQVGRPEVLRRGAVAPGRGMASLSAAVLCMALVLVLLSPLASEAPDGLESVAEQGGFASLATTSPLALFPDYSVQFIGDAAFSTIVAMILGTLVVCGLVLGVGQFTFKTGE